MSSVEHGKKSQAYKEPHTNRHDQISSSLGLEISNLQRISEERCIDKTHQEPIEDRCQTMKLQ